MVGSGDGWHCTAIYYGDQRRDAGMSTTVRQDRPSDMAEIKAEVLWLIKKLAMTNLGEAKAAEYRGRLRYVLGRWA